MAAARKDAPLSVEEYRAAQEAEWNQHIATERIYIGGALAFMPGHRVPAGHVTNGLVAKAQVTSPDNTDAVKEG